ncbi:MAG: hypothetical protein LBR20_01000 [Propionibacteriaceae bacterium]|jgi:hypothetical protein|nr:hypothetical protein [Propionibacteriaceae bacterium]
MTTSDFDLDRSVSQAWTEFSDRLAEVVSVMEPGSTLTLYTRESELPNEEPYIRFSCDANYNLCLEVSGNAELSLDFLLTDAQERQLVELGWTPPNLKVEPQVKNWRRVIPQEHSGLAADAAVSVLEEVFGITHPIFLRPDHLSELLNPPQTAVTGEAGYSIGELTAVTPMAPDHLRQLVALELHRILGEMPMEEAGELAVRKGSTMIFARIVPDTREVIIYSPVVHDIAGRTRAAELLSDLNTRGRMVKFMLLNDKVIISISVLTYPFVPAHINQAFTMVAEVADEMDEKLAKALDGKTFFEGLDEE